MFSGLFATNFVKICKGESSMSTFKEYAKRAKDRMKNGFWEQAKQNILAEKQVAATLGLNTTTVVEEQRRKIQRQIYDYDGFCEEQEFYGKVEQILTSAEVISNPIMRLADRQYLETLTPTERQTYLTKLAFKYRQAVERYNKLHG